MRGALWLMHTAAAVLLASAATWAAKEATDSQQLQLTDSNWQRTISDGAWLVEFYERAGHSADFFPTWKELVRNKASQAGDFPDAPFRFAQVDCYASMDLCKREGIDVLPRLLTYWEGKRSETQYIGNREYADLASYVDREAALFRSFKKVSDVPHPLPPKNETAAAGKQQPTPEQGAGAQPPPPAAPPAAPASPAQAPAGPVGPNAKGKITSFGTAPIETEEALENFLKKGAGVGPSFVKFFAPWCPHCKAMAPAYERLSESLKGRINVLEVDCVAYRDTCVKYGIQSFPTLRMYNDGQITEYRGGRNHDAMREWALKAGSSSGLKEIGADELESIRSANEVFFLYLFSPGTPEKEQDLTEKASTVLMSKPVPAFRSSDQRLLDRYGTYLRVSASSTIGAMSGLLVFKDHQVDQPISRLFPGEVVEMDERPAVEKIKSWINAERFPTVVELTGTTFSDVIYNDAKSLVVLAAVSDVHHGGNLVGTGSGSQERDLELRLFSQIALKWRAKPRALVRDRLLFAWIDADRWATAVKTYYKVKPVDLPRVLLIDGSQLQHYDLPSDSQAAARGQPWLDEVAIFDALEAISQGQVKPKSSKTVVDRTLASAGGAATSFVVAFVSHPYLGAACIVALLLLVFQFLRKTSRSGEQPLLPTSAGNKVD